MKAGDERKEGGLWEVWVICPDCGIGRWVQKANARRVAFTGRCKRCHTQVVRQHLAGYDF